MARGTIALILGLFVVAAIGVIIVTIFVAIFFRNDAPLSDLLGHLMRTLHRRWAATRARSSPRDARSDALRSTSIMTAR